MSGRQAISRASRGFSRSLVLVILAAVVLGGAVLVGAYLWLIPHAVNTGPALDGLNAAQRFTAAFAVATAAGAIVALVVNTRRQALAEAAAVGARLTQFTERFAAAASQLGRPTAAERIAGVYAMAALADDYTDKRQQCVDVLCGYLRLPWNPALDETQAVTVEESWTVIDGRTVIRRTSPAHTAHDRIVRTTILTVIRQHLLDPSAETAWCSLNYDFTGALLENASFGGATFSGEKISFEGATFSGKKSSFSNVSFSGENTWFGGATFSAKNTWFDNATFSAKSTWFDKATFSGENTWFERATFSGENTRFEWATFSGEFASFGGATFSGEDTQFEWATFSGENISFGGVTFHGETTSFRRATFSGKITQFDKATFSGDTSFGGATFSGKTTFDKATLKGQPFDPSASPE